MAGITYVDGPRLARAVAAAADWVTAGREEINRINVFPVPDGDTGTNFSLTLRTVADALKALGDAPLPETARTMAQAGVLGAVPHHDVAEPVRGRISPLVPLVLSMTESYPGEPVANSDTPPNPDEWWLRPVIRAARVGEQSAVE